MESKPDWAEDFVRRVMNWWQDYDPADRVVRLAHQKYAAELRARVGGWQPIESAPKDGTRIMLGYTKHIFTGIYVAIGKWDDDRYAKKPRPYWRHDLTHAGVTEMRANQPTHWMPLPAAPAEGGG